MQVKDLKKQYMVVVEDDILGEYILWNKNKKFFRNLEDAQKAIEEDKKKWKTNKPIVVNGMGISTEKLEKENTYHIEWRWISKWEKI